MSDCTMHGIAIVQKRRAPSAKPLEPTAKRGKKKNTDRVEARGDE